jgi:hypothetical protein
MNRPPGRGRRPERPEILRCLRERSERVRRISAKPEPTSGLVIAAVIFLVRFWIEPKMNTFTE